MLADVILKIAGQFQEKEDSKYYPRPSMAGKERCTRQIVYHGLNIPKEPLAGRAVMIFSDSSFHEDLTSDWIRKSAFQLHSEQMEVTVDMGFDFKLKGHIDGIVTDLLEVDYLWEHKAINHFSWMHYWDGARPYDNISQCCIYLRGLHSDNPNIKKAVLLMKNKNTAAYLEFIISYDYDTDTAVIERSTNSNGETKEINEIIPDAVRSCFEKFRYVNECIKNQTLPKRDYFIGDDWHCDYCAWGKTCWQGYKKEFTELKTDSMLPEEVETMIRYYKELGGQKSDIEKEYKELSEKVKSTMKEIGAREGRAGQYIVKLALIETDRIDKNLLTPTEIAKATKTTMSERLYVSEPKTKEKTNG
ncbi:MAG: hypothetical protein LLG05_09830 [Porphyromonadaceae bacterium]|nr:hypothetical protein [Porphyromonadaceae bacterium]